MRPRHPGDHRAPTRADPGPQAPTAPPRRDTGVSKPPPPPGDAPDAWAQRLAALAHELSSLLDGSMRSVNLALASHDTREGDAPDDMARRLRSVRAALEQMAAMVQAATRPERGRATLPRRRLGTETLSLHDAITNGVAILEPLAAEHGIALVTSLHDAARALPAGPAYTVVVNGVRNAVESVAMGLRSGKPVGRVVRIAMDLLPASHDGDSRAGTAGAPTAWVALSVTDQGEGPPKPDRSRRGRPFSPGYTTKPGGTGLGLAVCRDLLSQFGGTITLNANPDGGATLTARYPARGLPASVALPTNAPEGRERAA